MEAVKRTGRRIKTGHLDVRVAASPFAHARVGIVVPKYKRTVVERNTLRRRLRELVRTRMLPVIPACDVFIRAFPHAYKASFGALTADVERLVAQVTTQLVARPGPRHTP